MLDEVRERFDVQPATVLADAGYCNERDLTELETRGVDGYVATGRENKQVADPNLEQHPATGRMAKKLSTPAGRAAYAERKWLSEAPYGWVKHVLGFRCRVVRERRDRRPRHRAELHSVAGARQAERPYRQGVQHETAGEQRKPRGGEPHVSRPDRQHGEQPERQRPETDRADRERRGSYAGRRTPAG